MRLTTPHSFTLSAFLLLLCCLLTGAAQAQHDVIVGSEGQEIAAKVLVIRPDIIRYLRPDTASSDTLMIATRKVFMVRFANGTREVIHQGEAVVPTLSKAEAIARGRSDARQYFRAPGTFWGTYGATVIFPPAGLATGVLTSAFQPSRASVTVRDVSMLQNPDYMRAYRQQAQRKKIGKAAAGFGAGMGTLAVVVAILLNNTWHW